MYDIIDDLKSSISRIRLKYDIEQRDDSSYFCGMAGSSVSSAGGVIKIGQLNLTYGRTIQAFLDGTYAGLQCTSMALAAIIHNKIRSKFTPKRINKILTEGDRLHTLLREKVKLSDHPDGKVAIEDFPSVLYLNIGKLFGRQTEVKLRQECKNVFTSKPEGFEDFLTIKEYLEKWQKVHAKRMGFLISLRESSYAVILKKNGKAVLFDSHGHLRFNGEMVKQKAGVLKFPSLCKLESFIIDMYGIGAQAVIAPVSVSFKPQQYSQPREVRKVSKKAVTEYRPLFPTKKEDKSGTINAEAISQYDDEDSPFIGLMGGRY